MKHTHKFIAYKEIQVPNGKYLVKKDLGIDVKKLSTGVGEFFPDDVKELYDLCLILYCSSCGEIKGRKLGSK